MYKELKVKLANTLKAEFDYVRTHENEQKDRLSKMGDIYHLGQVIEHFDELEPVLQKFFAEKAEKERFNK